MLASGRGPIMQGRLDAPIGGFARRIAAARNGGRVAVGEPDRATVSLPPASVNPLEPGRLTPLRVVFFRSLCSPFHAFVASSGIGLTQLSDSTPWRFLTS